LCRGATKQISGVRHRSGKLVITVNWLELQKQIINPKEWALRHTQSLNDSECLTLCLSAKKSFFKAYYPFVKRYFGFEDAIISDIIVKGNRGSLTLVPEPVIASYLPNYSAFVIHFLLTEKGVISYHHMQTNSQNSHSCLLIKGC